MAQDCLQKNKATREILDEKKTKELNVVEAALNAELNIEKQQRKELSDKLADLLQKRAEELGEQLRVEREELLSVTAAAR